MMTKQQILQAELKSARKRVDALPAWRRAALERARAAEIDLGYIRLPSDVEANEPEALAMCAPSVARP